MDVDEMSRKIGDMERSLQAERAAECREEKATEPDEAKRAALQRLLLQAAQEIESLRATNERLAAYEAHTERMLALFESGGPRRQDMGAVEDVAWMLRKCAESYKPNKP